MFLDLLIILVFAVVPACPYSRGSGYYPSSGLEWFWSSYRS
jgi:hypothetical protein